MAQYQAGSPQILKVGVSSKSFRVAAYNYQALAPVTAIFEDIAPSIGCPGITDKNDRLDVLLQQSQLARGHALIDRAVDYAGLTHLIWQVVAL